MPKAKPVKAKKTADSWQAVQDRSRKLPVDTAAESPPGIVAKNKVSQSKAGSRWESEGGKTK